MQLTTLSESRYADVIGEQATSRLFQSREQSLSETWSKYVELSAITAIFGDKSDKVRRDYILLGMISELGEVAGKYKKLIRDGVFDEYAFLDEVGDVYWYLAAYCREHKMKDWPALSPDSSSYWKEDLPRSIGYAIETAASLMRDSNPSFATREVARILGVLCQSIDCPIELVLARNIDKLLDRKERGVIGGNGDKR
jgi:hypothetical protein